MTTIQPDMHRDIFVFYNPTFETVEECISHVQKNPAPLMWRLKKAYPNDKLDRIVCAPEENVRDILKQSIPNDTKMLDT